EGAGLLEAVYEQRAFLAGLVRGRAALTGGGAAPAGLQNLGAAVGGDDGLADWARVVPPVGAVYGPAVAHEHARSCGVDVDGRGRGAGEGDRGDLLLVGGDLLVDHDHAVAGLELRGLRNDLGFEPLG